MDLRAIRKVLTRRKVFADKDVQETSLARVLNTFDLTALGIGSTLGVGLYVLVGKVAKETAGPAVVLSFLIAAIASAFAALCYAEFGSRTPRAGSAYIYSYVCVGEFVAFVIGWNLILEYIIGSASVARGMSSYFDALIDHRMEDKLRDVASINVGFMASFFDFLAFGIAILLSIGLAFGLKESSKINNVFTILNLFVVLFVIIAGSTKADSHNWHLTVPANVTGAGHGGFAPFGFDGIVKGAATCFYGYVGFDCIATTGEEVKNPQKAIPIAILVSLTVVFLAYFVTSTVVTLMVPYYLQDVNSPISHAFEDFGWEAAKWIVTIGGILALCTSLFGAMFPLPRIIYAMANDGLVFRFLGKVSARFSTPVIGTLLAGLLTGLMAGLFEQGQLVDMMSIGTLLAYTIVAACVLLLRYSVGEDGYLLIRSESDSSVDTYTDSRDMGPVNYPKSHLSTSRIMKQIFNTSRDDKPTKLSETLVTVQVCIYCFLCLVFGLCVIYMSNDLSEGDVYAIVIITILACTMAIVLLSIATQPTSKRSLSFKVPLVPLIPALSILVNIYLMLSLDKNTWIRFGVWMGVGLPIYIYSAFCEPQRQQLQPHHQQVANEAAIASSDTNLSVDMRSSEKDSAYFEGSDSHIDDFEIVKETSFFASEEDFERTKIVSRRISTRSNSYNSNIGNVERVEAVIHRQDEVIIEDEVFLKNKNSVPASEEIDEAVKMIDEVIENAEAITINDVVTELDEIVKSEEQKLAEAVNDEIEDVGSLTESIVTDQVLNAEQIAIDTEDETESNYLSDDNEDAPAVRAAPAIPAPPPLPDFTVLTLPKLHIVKTPKPVEVQQAPTEEHSPEEEESDQGEGEAEHVKFNTKEFLSLRRKLDVVLVKSSMGLPPVPKLTKQPKRPPIEIELVEPSPRSSTRESIPSLDSDDGELSRDDFRQKLSAILQPHKETKVNSLSKGSTTQPRASKEDTSSESEQPNEQDAHKEKMRNTLRLINRTPRAELTITPP